MYIRLMCYVLIAVILLAIPLEVTESGSICLIYNLTGHKCITCGMTRAFANALRFDFLRAISYNPLILIVFPAYIALFFNDIYVFVKRKLGYNSTSIAEKLINIIFFNGGKEK